MNLKNSILFITLIILSVTIVMNSASSVYGIGARVEGDQLLINDTLYERLKTEQPSNHTIEFKYPVNKPLSYIEVSSNSNFQAQFGLTHEDMLYGLVTTVDSPEFEIKIRVFGIDEENAPAHFHPVLSPDKQLEKLVVPLEFEFGDEDDEDEFYDVNNAKDNILMLGDRQSADKLIYETFAHSYASEKSENHSVVFYFIDVYYLTYAEFITIHTSTASAVYSQISDHSIKAVIIDENVKSLDVTFKLYGYEPNEKPSDYISMVAGVMDTNSVDLVKSEKEQQCPPQALMTPTKNHSTGMVSNSLLIAFYFLILRIISY